MREKGLPKLRDNVDAKASVYKVNKSQSEMRSRFVNIKGTELWKAQGEHRGNTL